jgi:hypothetical protein
MASFRDRRMIMKRTLLAAFTILAIAVPGTGETKSIMPHAQTCSGVLVESEPGYYNLNPDIGSGLWCDADIAEDLSSKVLKVCPVGVRCRIKGTVHGRGAFSWIKITSIQNLGNINFTNGFFPELRGRWCLTKNPPPKRITSCNNFFEVTSKGFTTEMGTECVPDHVRPLTRGWSIKFKCEGESFNTEQVWYLDRKLIVVEHVNPNESTKRVFAESSGRI